MEQTIHERLLALAEPDFQAFTSRLLPGTDNVLGVRLPKLRRLAKEIAGGDWRAFLAGAQAGSFEETMLRGMVIGYAKTDSPELLCHIEKFIPEINNWSVCDSFCSGLKRAREEPQAMWAFLQPYLQTHREFEARFGAVMLLFYFIDDYHIHDVLTLLDQIPAQGYYARMAVAWAVSACYVRYPDITIGYLTAGHSLDDATWHRALQKIIESRCVGRQAKEEIRRMKRRDSAGI